MKNKSSNLDEMQEQKLLHIEHNACWFAFAALFVSMVVQVIMYDQLSAKYVAGEWIVFMCLCIYISGACLKNGIWDRKLKADTPTNIKCSIVAALLSGIIMFVFVFKRSHMVVGSIASGLFIGVFAFALCFGALTVSAKMYKKRVEQMEQEDSE